MRLGDLNDPDSCRRRWTETVAEILDVSKASLYKVVREGNHVGAHRVLMRPGVHRCDADGTRLSCLRPVDVDWLHTERTVECAVALSRPVSEGHGVDLKAQSVERSIVPEVLRSHTRRSGPASARRPATRAPRE